MLLLLPFGFFDKLHGASLRLHLLCALIICSCLGFWDCTFAVRSLHESIVQNMSSQPTSTSNRKPCSCQTALKFAIKNNSFDSELASRRARQQNSKNNTKKELWNNPYESMTLLKEKATNLLSSSAIKGHLPILKPLIATWKCMVQ